MKTLYVMIACCLEQGRKDIFENVVENLVSQSNFDQISKNLVVFDNCSTVDITDLLSKFNCVLRSDRNIGYWTALRYVAHMPMATSYKYVYSIESDCMHDKIERLQECEDFLDTNHDVGMIRTQEFFVEEADLYNKDKPKPNSRIYAWQRQTNRFRNSEPVFFEHATGNIFKTNFTPVVCGLNRLSSFKSALDEMAKMSQISEADFQSIIDKQFAFTGLYNGGLFHSKLSFANMNIVAGSRPNTHVHGYRSTQHDKIDLDGSYSVERIK